MRKLNLFFLMLACRIAFRMSNSPIVARRTSSGNANIQSAACRRSVNAPCSEAGPAALISSIGGAIAVVLLVLVRAECGGLFPVAPIEFAPVIGYAGQTDCRSEVALRKTDLAVEILTAQQIRVCWRPRLASPHV
ncbi:hypothetical protein ACFTZK_08770 [Streptomyces decoyicus]|uniref:hypothetical protein n=1 Tax=Streptomyces decoyicus TaxID=249567 RepID=UPI003628432B